MTVGAAAVRELRPHEHGPLGELRAREKLFARLPDALAHVLDLAPEDVPRGLFAIEQGGAFAGVAACAMAEALPELWFTALLVAPPHRGRTLGGAAHAFLEGYARDHGARRLLTKVYADSSPGLRFAATRGYREIGASINAQLNVAAFDPAAWPDPREVLEGQGLQVVPLSALPEPARTRDLLAVWNASRPFEPQYWPFVPYSPERFEREVLGAPDIAPDHSLAVLEGEEVLAFTLNALEGARLFTVYSGVHPQAWRRGIAGALKLELVLHARRAGIHFLATENEARNDAMWAINRRLGYRRLSELIVYHKELP